MSETLCVVMTQKPRHRTGRVKQQPRNGSRGEESDHPAKQRQCYQGQVSEGAGSAASEKRKNPSFSYLYIVAV